MKNKELKPLAELLATTGSPLRELAEQAARRTDLGSALSAALPTELADHLLGANLRADGVLVVLADSPVWAARLRFEGDRLLARCRELYPQTMQVRIRVAGPAGDANS